MALCNHMFLTRYFRMYYYATKSTWSAARIFFVKSINKTGVMIDTKSFQMNRNQKLKLFTDSERFGFFHNAYSSQDKLISWSVKHDS